MFNGFKQINKQKKSKLIEENERIHLWWLARSPSPDQENNTKSELLIKDKGLHLH